MNRIHPLALAAVAACALAACGGSDGDTAPLNTLPAGVLADYGDARRVFELASVTKPLVARAAQVAVEEGVLDLDTPAGPPGATVRHLLAHASGLAMHSDRVLAKPGTRRMYSNYGFTVLAETVQRESGIEFGHYLTEAVCAPLAMASTRLDGGADTPLE